MIQERLAALREEMKKRNIALSIIFTLITWGCCNLCCADSRFS